MEGIQSRGYIFLLWMIKLIDVQKHWVSSLTSQCYLKSLFIAINSPICVENIRLETEFCSAIQAILIFIFFHVHLVLQFLFIPGHFSFILFFFCYFHLILCCFSSYTHFPFAWYYKIPVSVTALSILNCSFYTLLSIPWWQ